METFEFNKYAAGLLFTLLALFVINIVADSLVSPIHLTQSVYVVGLRRRPLMRPPQSR